MSAGIKLGLVSNFDTRLRPLLAGLGLTNLFDTIIVSAEEGFEKPNPLLFERACERMGVLPHQTVHVGDDRRYVCACMEERYESLSYARVMFTH